MRAHIPGRALLGLHALPALLLVAVAACAQAARQPVTTTEPSPSTDLAIPTGQLPARVQCLVDRGFRITEVRPPQAEWDLPEYVFEFDLPTAQAMEVLDECGRLNPTVQKTDDELRVIYERWIKERTCLVELGYQPAEPPSLEKFLSDWRSPNGPWMPIDGVDTGSWTGAEYELAKSKCILEMFDRG